MNDKIRDIIDKLFYELIDSGKSADEAYDEICGYVDEDLPMVVEAYKSTNEKGL